MALQFRGARVRLNWFRLTCVVVALAAGLALFVRLATPAGADAPTGAPDEGALRQSLGTSPHPR